LYSLFSVARPRPLFVFPRFPAAKVFERQVPHAAIIPLLAKDGKYTQMTSDELYQLREAGRLTLLAVILVLTAPFMAIVEWVYDHDREQCHLWRLILVSFISLALAFKVLMWVDGG
jgi:hypothetical protein